jgi:hypothetical protein
VPELRHAPRFLEEAVANHVAGGDVGLDDLDGDGTVERLVAAEVDGAHSALTQQAVDGVLTGNRRPYCVDGLPGLIGGGHVLQKLVDFASFRLD